MAIKWCLLISCFFVFFSCSNKQTKINLLEHDESGLFIPVCVNGIPFVFCIDTGAKMTAIKYSSAQKAGIIPTSVSHNKILTVSAIHYDSLFYGNGDIQLGDVHIDCEMILDGYKTRLSGDFEYNDYDGVLGVDILRQFNWLFDLKNRNLIFSKEMIEVNDKLMFSFDVDYSFDVTYVNLILNDTLESKFLFDTGYAASIRVDIGDYSLPISFLVSDTLFNQLQNDRRDFSITKEPLSYLLMEKVKINNVDNPYVVVKHGYELLESHENMIHQGFLIFFDAMYYDSQHKKLNFYVSNEDSCMRYEEDSELLYKNMRRIISQKLPLDSLFKK